MVQGRADELDRQRRFAANWLSPLLSATAGQVITPAQMLGEDPEANMTTEQKIDAATRAGERKLAEITKKMKKKSGG